jgi:hypothetical protein
MKQPASGGGRMAGCQSSSRFRAGAVLGRPFSVPFWLGTASRMTLPIYACASRQQEHL